MLICWRIGTVVQEDARFRAKVYITTGTLDGLARWTHAPAMCIGRYWSRLWA